MRRNNFIEDIRLWLWVNERDFEDKFGYRATKMNYDERLLNRHPVDMLLASIDPEHNEGARADTEQLLAIVATGQHLFCAAVTQAAEADDTAFFVAAFEGWREEVNTVLAGFGYDQRCNGCGGILPHTGGSEEQR